MDIKSIKTYIEDQEERLKSIALQRKRYRRLHIQGMRELYGYIQDQIKKERTDEVISKARDP